MTFEEKTISSEIIYDGVVFRVRKDKVVVKDGSTSYREIIDHNGGAVVIPIKDNGNIVLIKQFRKAMEKDMIELPAGKVEKGELPSTTVERELKEETGYSAEEIKLISEFNPSVGYANETLYIYIATGLTEGNTNFDPHEDIEIFDVPLKTAEEMVINGEITDGKTVAGILLTKYFL